MIGTDFHQDSTLQIGRERIDKHELGKYSIGLNRLEFFRLTGGQVVVIKNHY